MASCDPSFPERIGVVGVGTIGAAVVRGLCSRPMQDPPSIVLSPRGAAKAAKLAADFPSMVTVAASNQEVVDKSDCIIVSVLPKQAEDVLRALEFRPEQKILSLIATVDLERLSEFTAPAKERAIAVPLPAVAKGCGATLLVPPKDYAKAIFEPLGSCVAVEDFAQFRRMQCITGLMGDFYKRQLTAQSWLSEHGVAASQAASWVGAIFATMAADSARPGPRTFEALVAEQTPGGLNEMVWRDQDADCSYEALAHSLDAVHHRLSTGSIDEEQKPAAKRRRLQ